MRRTLLAFTLALAAAGCAGGPAPSSGPSAPAWSADVAPDSVARWALRSCRATARRGACYERALLAVIPAGGPERALAALDRISETDADVRREGHVYAHGIGIAAYAGASTVAETFARCTPGWQSGCYHGVIQAYFADPAAGELDAARLNALCGRYGGDSLRWLQFQCTHGMGHGLMAVHSHHLLRALDDCDKLRTASEREGCYGGAFMENVVNATQPHHASTTNPGAHAGHAPAGEHAQHAPPADEHAGHAGHAAAAPAPFRALDDAEPLYPCTIVADRHKSACLAMQTSAILFRNGGDFPAAARQCARLEGGLANTCYASLGRDAAAYAGADDARAVRLCGAAGEAHLPWCVVGTVKNRIDVAADPAPGIAYCGQVPDGPARAACYRAVGEQIVLLRPTVAGREQACAVVAEPYRAACRRGALILPPPSGAR